MRIRALVAIVGLLLTTVTVDALAVTQVKSVRLWRAPDNTRLVFDLSGPVQHSVFTLSAPDRLVIDINGATLAAPLKVATSNTPISSVRSAQRTPTDLRVVVDLKKSVTPKSFTLAPNAQYGNRLVVDLYDQEADAIAATAPTPPPTPVQTPATTPAVPVTPTQPAIKLPPVPSGKRDIVIAIDAGHGGEDPGASGSRGQHEKDIVLQIAQELQRQINTEKGFRAELTRTGDYFIPLRKRTELARKKGADLFVSIHADAAPSKAAHDKGDLVVERAEADCRQDVVECRMAHDGTAVRPDREEGEGAVDDEGRAVACEEAWRRVEAFGLNPRVQPFDGPAEVRLVRGRERQMLIVFGTPGRVDHIDGQHVRCRRRGRCRLRSCGRRSLVRLR